MRQRIAMAAVLALAGCGSGPSNTSAPNAPVAAESPQPPSHNYAQEAKGTYYYVTAVSDNDKANGQGAGNVLGFRYLGKNEDGEYALAMLGSDDSPLGTAYCQNPCAVIRMSSGEKMGFAPDTVIGNAFTDAFNGQMKSVSPRRTASSRN